MFSLSEFAVQDISRRLRLAGIPSTFQRSLQKGSKKTLQIIWKRHKKEVQNVRRRPKHPKTSNFEGRTSNLRSHKPGEAWKMEEKQWLWSCGCGAVPADLWLRICGCGAVAVELWLWSSGCHLLELILGCQIYEFPGPLKIRILEEICDPND